MKSHLNLNKVVNHCCSQINFKKIDKKEGTLCVFVLSLCLRPPGSGSVSVSDADAPAASPRAIVKSGEG
jgi:hypothetical protein